MANHFPVVYCHIAVASAATGDVAPNAMAKRLDQFGVQPSTCCDFYNAFHFTNGFVINVGGFWSLSALNGTQIVKLNLRI